MNDFKKMQKQMAQQMTGFYKNTIDNIIKAATIIQENTEKMVSSSLEQSPWIPEENRKFFNDWMKAYRKGYEDLKIATDEQYKKFEAFLNLQKNTDLDKESEDVKAKKKGGEEELVKVIFIKGGDQYARRTVVPAWR